MSIIIANIKLSEKLLFSESQDFVIIYDILVP